VVDHIIILVGFQFPFAFKNTPPWALAGLPSHGGAGHLPSIGGPFEGEVGGIEGRGGTNCAPLSAQGPGCLSCQGGHPNPIFAWVTEQGWCYKYKNTHIYIYLKPDWPVYKWDDPPSRTFKIGFLDGRSWPAILELDGLGLNTASFCGTIGDPHPKYPVNHRQLPFHVGSPSVYCIKTRIFWYSMVLKPSWTPPLWFYLKLHFFCIG
jgi:hypothetical protein